MEINNSIPSNQPSPKKDEEIVEHRPQQTEKPAQTSASCDEWVMSSQAQHIRQVSDALAQQPAVDMQRVMEVKARLAETGLNILTDNASSEDTFLRIADRILDVESSLHDDFNQKD